MKASSLVFGIALVFSGNLLAQDAGLGAGASSQSTTSVSVRGDGVNADHQSNAAAAASGRGAAAGGAAAEMNATLSKPIDARRAKAGDEVTATLEDDARANGGTTLPRGTRLVGRVTESRPHARRSSSAGGDVGSRLGIVFDRAVLADGREIPVAATIRAVASNDADAAASFAGADRGIGGGVFGAGNTAGSGSVGSTGIIGGAAGLAGGAAGVGSTAGGALAGAGGAAGGRLSGAGGLRHPASEPLGSIAHASAGAAGGVSAAGRLVAGSRGVFGLPGIDLTSSAVGAGQASVLTSHTRNVALERGTKMLLVGEVAGGGTAAVGGSATTQTP